MAIMTTRPEIADGSQDECEEPDEGEEKQDCTM